MLDQRWIQIADILVNYSTCVKPEEKVLITMMEIDTYPLMHAVYMEVVKAGGFPQVEFQSAYLERELMKYGSQEQLSWIPELSSFGMEWADVYIGLRGNRNPFEFADIESPTIKVHKKAMGHISAMRNDLTRWVLMRVPNESLAQQAGMSLDDMMNFFFEATIRDWKKESTGYYKLKEIFEGRDKIRVTGNRTDISFSITDRKFAVGDGILNMPDGEIYTSPQEDSIEGHIFFDFPGIYAGQQIEGIYFEFKEGKLIKYSAEKNQELLEHLINMDQGSSTIGEFGIGTNYGISRFCSDILFDEKIGGTIHFALGRGYKECGGENHSALHWDIIKDLRDEGEIYLDGELVFQKGYFLV